MKILFKYLISIFTLVNISLADDLYVKVNFSDSTDIFHNTSFDYYSANASQLNFATDNPENNMSKIQLSQSGYSQQGSNCWKKYCSNDYSYESWAYTSGYNNIFNRDCSNCSIDTNSIAVQACAGISLLDSYLNINKLMKYNSSLGDSKLESFRPKVEIKRGTFSLKEGNTSGALGSNYLDINILSIAINKMISLGNPSINTDILTFIKNNMNLKNWKLIFYKSSLSVGASDEVYYLRRTYEKLNELYSIPTISDTDKNYLEYLIKIFQLGNNLSENYFPSFGFSSAATKTSDVCIPNTSWNDLLGKVNTAIANNSNDSSLVSFMSRFSIDKSILKFNKTAYTYSFTTGTKQSCDGNSCNSNNYSCGGDDSCYCNCNSTKYASATNPILKKIYGYKVLTKEGREWGTYARTIKYDASTTATGNTSISIQGGSEGDTSTNTESTDNFAESMNTLNQYNTTPIVSSSDSVNEMAVAVNQTVPSNLIEEVCSTDIDEKFSGNLIYIDHQSLMLGNNEFLVKDDFNDMNKIKLSSNIVNPVYEKVLNQLRKDHLIMNLNETLFTKQKQVPIDAAGVILTTNFATMDELVEFPDMSKDLKDLAYYYLWYGGDNEACKVAMNNKSTTTPFVLMSNTTTDLLNYTSGGLKNQPSEGEGSSKYNQYATSVNVTVINTMEDGFDRGTDGEIDAEISKRLDINSKSGKFTYDDSTTTNLEDKALFPDNIFSFAYTVGYKPKDTDVFNTYGPVGPFWEKTEKTISSTYEGCDEEITEDGPNKGTIPSQRTCENEGCEAITCSWREFDTTKDIYTSKVMTYTTDIASTNSISVCNDNSVSIFLNEVPSQNTIQVLYINGDITNKVGVNCPSSYVLKNINATNFDSSNFTANIHSEGTGCSVKDNTLNFSSIPTSSNLLSGIQMYDLAISKGKVTSSIVLGDFLSSVNNNYYKYNVASCPIAGVQLQDITLVPNACPIGYVDNINATTETNACVQEGTEVSSSDENICNTKESEYAYNLTCTTPVVYNNGTYSIYDQPTNTCSCSSGIDNPIDGTPLSSSYTAEGFPKQSSTEGLQFTQYSKFCYLTIEPMLAKVKKVKYHFEPEKNNSSELDISGFAIETFSTGDKEATQWGGWTQSDWSVSSDIEIEGYLSDSFGDEPLKWKVGEVEPNCDWTQDFVVNGQTYTSSDIVELTQSDLTELASYTEGIKFAKKQLYTYDNEIAVSDCLKRELTGGLSESETEARTFSCLKEVYSNVTGVNTNSMSESAFSNNFNTKVINYYLKANDIGFGRKFVIRPETTGVNLGQIVSKKKTFKLNFLNLGSLFSAGSSYLKDKAFKVKQVDKVNVKNIDIFWNQDPTEITVP